MGKSTIHSLGRFRLGREVLGASALALSVLACPAFGMQMKALDGGMPSLQQVRPNWQFQLSQHLENRSSRVFVPDQIRQQQNILQMARYRSLLDIYEEGVRRAVNPELRDSLRQEANERLLRIEERRNRGMMNSYEFQMAHNELEGWLYKGKDNVLERVKGSFEARNNKDGEDLGNALLRAVPELQYPAGAVGSVLWVYQGRSIPIPLLPGKLEFVARTPVPQKVVEVEVHSMLFDSVVRADFKVPETAELGRPTNNLDDRFRVKISRVLPVLGVGAEITYGSTTRATSMKFERGLFQAFFGESVFGQKIHGKNQLGRNLRSQELVGSVELLQPLDPVHSHIKEANHLVKLQYAWQISP
jgi:hypothetical protein